MEKQEKKPPLLILTGPTAAGKTALSIRLAKAVGGEIVSADSMQVYRGMDIGSAKATREEMAGVPHHLIDVLDPEEDFNVVRFQQLALSAIASIQERGHLPILTGGTGFYIQSVLYGIDFTETREDEGLRDRLEQLAKREGPEKLHAMLREADPEAAASIHPNNVKRVIRALEFSSSTGSKISDHNRQQRQKEPVWNSRYLVLTDGRDAIYERIDRRVDEMIRKGLVEEVAALKGMGLQRGAVSMQGLGYKEILAFLDGECSLEEAVYRIKRDTRHFAKRQLTWFKREKNVIWVDRREFLDENSILQFLIGQAKEIRT